MRPLFIGGCVRSGTTMLGAILGSHPQCVVTPESQFKVRLLTERGYTIDKLKKDFRFQLWKMPDAKIVGIDEPRATLLQLVKQYNDINLQKAASVWIDHTTTNLKFSRKLSTTFPDAQFVHIVRDGRAVASSLMQVDWGPVNIVDAANLWISRIGFALGAESALGSKKVIRVRFEDILENPHDSIRRICDFVSIDYQDAMLAGTDFRVPNYTRNQHQLVGKAPEKSKATRWQNELTEREIEIFEDLTGDLLTYFGYERHFEKTKPLTRSEKRKYKWMGLVKYRLDAIRNSIRKMTHRSR